MKKVFSLLLVLLLIVSLPVNTEAATVAEGVCGDNLTWVLDDEGTLTISGEGEMTDAPWLDDYTDQITFVVIGDGVTSLCTEAFYCCGNLTTVELPDSIAVIGSAAFNECTSLTGITIPSGVTTIQSMTFMQCPALESASIPESVTVIEDYAFYGCGKLTSVTIPSGVTSIGENAFASSGLTSVTIPAGVTTISDNTFCYCYDLAEVKLLGNVTAINDWAFGDCESLTSIELPETVTWIGDWAFYSSGLTSITIPEGVTAIGCYSFRSCTGLTSITIPHGVSTIDERAFSDCEGLTDISLPASITSIGANAFSSCSTLTDVYYGSTADRWNAVFIDEGNTCLTDAQIHYTDPCTDGHSYGDDNICSGCGNVKPVASGYCGDENVNGGQDVTWVLDANGTLTIAGTGEMASSPWSDNYAYDSEINAVVIEAGVTSVCDHAFYSFDNLTAVKLPEGITSIGSSAFCYCDRLESITLPSTLTTLGDSAFNNCTGLTSITIPAGVSAIGTSAFFYCTALEEVYLSEGLESIGSYAFYNTAIEEIELPSSVTVVGDNAFQSCTALTRADLHGVTTLGEAVFSDCSSLTNVYIPDTVTEIPAYAFNNCTALASITLPEKLTTIGQIAFSGTVITTLEIPEGVTSIGGYAFGWCDNLSTILFRGDAPAIGEGAFYNVTATAYYPASKTTWADDVMLDYNGTVTWIEAVDSGSCGESMSWTLDNAGTLSIFGTGGMEYYEDSAAYDMPGWTDYSEDIVRIEIGEGVRGIDGYTFYGCSNLKSLSIPSTLTHISTVTRDTYASPVGLVYCSSLESIEVSPYNTVFYADWQGGLYDLTAKKLLFVTRNFSGEFIMNSDVTGIADCAFESCTGLTGVVFPETLEWIGYRAFAGCTGLETVILPESLTVLGDKAFSNCTAMQSLYIPAGIDCSTSGTVLNITSLITCTSLKEINVSTDNAWYYSRDGVLYSGNGLLLVPPGYSGTVTIPSDVTSFSNKSSCAGISEIVVEEGNTYLFVDESGVLHSSDGLLIKAPNTLSGQYQIPEYTDAIDSYAFYGCTELESIVFPGECGFYGGCFKNITIDAYVPSSYSYYWTDEVMLDYGGDVTWHFYGPVGIADHPESVTVAEGEIATVTVVAQGEGLTYQWYWAPADSSDFQLTTSFTGDTYSVSMNAARAGRRVYCVVTDRFGNTAQTYVASLNMKKTELAITQQPVSVTVAEGETAKVTVVAVGDGLSYRWYYKNAGDSSYTYTSSFKGNSYYVTMSEARNGRWVLCRVYDTYGNVVQTNTVKLSMSATELAITQQPVSVTVAEGETATVTVGAVGDGLTYKWYYKNPGASTYTYTSSFKGNTYSVTMNDARNGRFVLCRVYDKYGNVVQTNTVKLSMKNTVKIVQQPVSVTVAEGEMAAVTVVATGDGLTYRWYYKNPGESTYTYTSTYTGNTYKVPMNEARNGRWVLCRVYDKYGNVVQTNTVVLRMK